MDPAPKERNWVDIYIGMAIFLASFVFLLTMHRFVYGGTHSTIGPLFFPRFIITLVVVLSLTLVLIGWLNGNRKCVITRETSARMPQTVIPVCSEEPEKTSNKNIVIYLGILFFYLISLYLIGFIISTTFVMVMVGYILGARNMFTFAPMALGFSVALYYIALKLMKIMLPLGILFE